VETGAGCIGTPDDAIAYIENLLDGAGGFGAIMELAHNWADWGQTKRHYELMARYVHPHFQRNANALRDFSYDDAKAKYATAGAQMKAAVQAATEKYQAGKK
jgi:limonene 1,2-monooxygenase